MSSKRWFQSMNWQHTTRDALIWNQYIKWNGNEGWHRLPGPGWRVRVCGAEVHREYRTLYGAKMAAKHRCG